MRPSRLTVVTRRVAGFVWLAVWIAVLYLVAAPWRELGGLVDERLRWLEWFVIVSGLSVGFTVGRFGRDACGPGTGRTYVGFLRFLLYPPAALVALGLIVLTYLGHRGSVGVVVSAFLAYWAGLDLAFGAVPLMEGRSYRLTRPLDPDPEPSERPIEGWTPPWERL